MDDMLAQAPSSSTPPVLTVHLPGQFRIEGGTQAPARQLTRRAAELIQLLCLAPQRSLPREQVLEALWPQLDPEAAAANLRKAAHHARHFLGDADSVLLGGGRIVLLPGRGVNCDAHRFEAAADAALAGGEAAACAAAAQLYAGELCPEARYEPWAEAPRRRLRDKYLRLLRQCGQHERLAREEPADEPAHLALMRAELAAGRRTEALRWYSHLRDHTLRGEARLLNGQLDAAEVDLVAGGRLHRAIGGATGEALSLQRRAELALYRGQRELARSLLDEALDVARQSDVGFHLLDRIYGTRIALARHPDAALGVLEEAEAAVRGPLETCPGCRITFAVPATIAAARAGETQLASSHLRLSEYLANVVMKLPAWHAALHEARAHVAWAGGDEEGALRGFAEAAQGFGGAGQPLDEARCRVAAREGVRVG